jgi:hypothetical protein
MQTTVGKQFEKYFMKYFMHEPPKFHDLPAKLRPENKIIIHSFVESETMASPVNPRNNARFVLI